MKKTASFFTITSVIFSLMLFECSSNSENKKLDNVKTIDDSDEIVSTPVDTVKRINTFDSLNTNTLANNLDNITNQPTTELPFGCKNLIEYKFPKTWESQGQEPYSQPIGINKEHNKAIYEITKCYNDLNNAKSYLLPIIRKCEYIKLNDKENIPTNDSLIYLTKQCKYKLPNFGMYECYYSYNSGMFVEVREKVTKVYNSEVGYLVFYDKATGDAKCIKVYDQWNDEETWNSYTYFFIDVDKSINIFNVTYGETEIEISKNYTIKVKDFGEITIKNELL
jgi:hypothetical protein